MEVRLLSLSSFPEFDVYEEDKRLIHLKIDIGIQAFRITCPGNKRVFFIADEVIKKTTITTLLNEYSQQLGSLTKSKLELNGGEIEIEGTQYRYNLKDGFIKEINIFEQNNYQPVLSCKLAPGQLSFLNEGYLNYLLFSLAWFRFLSEKQPAFVEFAEV